MKKIALCFALFLGGCSAPPIVLEKVSFVDKERTFPIGLVQDETRVVGVLLAEISAKEDLLKYKGIKYVTKSFQAQTCDMDINLMAWPGLTPIVKPTSENFYYHLLLHYKGTAQENDPFRMKDFNLISSPEDICINSYYGAMLSNAISNVVRYEISDSLLQTMKDYEEKSGEVYFK